MAGQQITSEAIEKGQLVINAAYVAIFVGAFIVARMLMQEQETRAAAENLADNRDRKASNGLVKLTRPFFSQYVVPIIRGKPFFDDKRKLWRRKIIAGGLRDELTPDEFIAFKLVLILFFPVAGGMANAAGLVDLPWYSLLATGIVGWFYPNMWVKGRIEQRQKQIRRGMPFIVDLLALSTEAGLDFVGAMGKVVEKATPSPLVEEFDQALREIKLGSSRSQALREIAARCDMSEIGSFIAILISADQMGASIGKILRQQSEQVRGQRFVAAEKAGALAAQKLMLPIVLFIMPAVFLMIFGPFAIESMGLSGK